MNQDPDIERLQAAIEELRVRVQVLEENVNEVARVLLNVSPSVH